MSLVAFLLSVVLISLSGVLMPGPVTAIVMAKGSQKLGAGSLVALGHGVVEFPLIALIYLGVGVLFQQAGVKIAIGFLGGGMLIWMGIEMLVNFRRAQIKSSEREINPFVGGILLSAGNPYFLIWWATVGAGLVMKSIKFGYLGVGLLAIVHWSCDLGWLQFLSLLSFQGGKFFGKKLQMAIFLVCGLAMIYFGGNFILNAVMSLTSK